MAKAFDVVNDCDAVKAYDVVNDCDAVDDCDAEKDCDVVNDCDAEEGKTMSAFISRLHKLSPKKNKERLFLQEKSDDNDKLHKSVGRLSNSTSCTLPVKSSSGSDSPRCSADGTRHALTDGEEDSTENRSVRQLTERSGKPPIKAKPRRPLRSISSDKGRSPEVSLSDSGSVSSLPSVRSLSQRYMPGRRFSETSADSDVFDAPSPTLRHGTLDKDREDPGQRGFDLREMRNVGSLDSTLTNGNWRSKPTEYWSTEDVVEWSEGLGIDKLPKIFHSECATPYSAVGIWKDF